MTLEEWNDARLDDFYAAFRRVEGTVERISVIEASLASVGEDIKQCRRNVHGLRNDFAEQAVTMRSDMLAAETRKSAERKSDRRWLIGTCLSTAALIIAAAGILVSSL